MWHPQLLFQKSLSWSIWVQFLGKKKSLTAHTIFLSSSLPGLLASIPPRRGRTCQEAVWRLSHALPEADFYPSFADACPACLSLRSYSQAWFICLYLWVFFNAVTAACISGILGFCFLFSVSWQQAPPFGGKSASAISVTRTEQAGRWQRWPNIPSSPQSCAGVGFAHTKTHQGSHS